MDERMDNEVKGQDTLKGVRIPNITRHLLFVVPCSGWLWLQCAKKEGGGGRRTAFSRLHLIVKMQ